MHAEEFIKQLHDGVYDLQLNSFMVIRLLKNKRFVMKMQYWNLRTSFRSK